MKSIKIDIREKLRRLPVVPIDGNFSLFSEITFSKTDELKAYSFFSLSAIDHLRRVTHRLLALPPRR